MPHAPAAIQEPSPTGFRMVWSLGFGVLGSRLLLVRREGRKEGREGRANNNNRILLSVIPGLLLKVLFKVQVVFAELLGAVMPWHCLCRSSYSCEQEVWAPWSGVSG